MGPLPVTVYLNEATDFFNGFDAGTARLITAVTFDADLPPESAPASAVSATLEDIYRELNLEPETEWARRYRLAGHRSLSVGDVVVVGETARAVGRFGWDPVSTDELSAAIARGETGSEVRR